MVEIWVLFFISTFGARRWTLQDVYRNSISVYRGLNNRWLCWVSGCVWKRKFELIPLSLHAKITSIELLFWFSLLDKSKLPRNTKADRPYLSRLISILIFLTPSQSLVNQARNSLAHCRIVWSFNRTVSRNKCVESAWVEVHLTSLTRQKLFLKDAERGNKPKQGNSRKIFCLITFVCRVKMPQPRNSLHYSEEDSLYIKTLTLNKHINMKFNIYE